MHLVSIINRIVHHPQYDKSHYTSNTTQPYSQPQPYLPPTVLRRITTGSLSSKEIAKYQLPQPITKQQLLQNRHGNRIRIYIYPQNVHISLIRISVKNCNNCSPDVRVDFTSVP